MKMYKQISGIILYSTTMAICIFGFSSLMILQAQEFTPNAPTGEIADIDTGNPVARNAWEEIYFRINDPLSTKSVVELLKSMELEKDQAGLASSYVIILQDQIYSFRSRYQEEPIFTRQIVNFLLDKISEQSEIVMQEHPEIANMIGLLLIPELQYGAVMGKSISALGHLKAKNFSDDIIRYLEEINNIMSISDKRADKLAFDYAATGCLNALTEFKTPSAFTVLLQVSNGPFQQAVRNQAASLMRLLKKEFPEEVKKHFLDFVQSSKNLELLDIVINSMNANKFNFDKMTSQELNLALLAHMNRATWVTDNQGLEAEILRKTIDNILANGTDGMEKEASEQLKQSYLNTDSMNVQLLALQGIGQLNSKNGIQFLQGEIDRLNIQQRAVAITSSEQRILRQLLYSLYVSKDSSEDTIKVLRDVTMTPYPSVIHKIATDILSNIS